MLLSTFQLSCQDNEGNKDMENKRIVNLIPEKKPVKLTDEQKVYVDACNDFSFNLFRLSGSNSESRILSPLSVAYLLGMLNDGADGETSEEIMDVLGLAGADKQSLNEFCLNLIENAPEVDAGVSLNIANALFVNKEITLFPAFCQDMENYYHATALSLDFSSPSAVKEINKWSSKQTDGMISKILDVTTASTVSYLLNAICFKANWTDHFDPNHTTEEQFCREDGSKTVLPMMHRKAKAYVSLEDDYTALCLPYSNWAFTMFVLLPNESVTTEDVVNNLSADSFSEMKKHMDTYEVDISIPRFSSVLRNDLTAHLKQMGIRTAFTDEAEFPYITAQNLQIGKILQVAKIEVDETGTKTAAVTVTNTVTANEKNPCEFHANRPFVYVIQELTSGAIFFVGTYMGD